MAEQNNVGSFVWYDLMSSSPSDSIQFYGNIIGWGTEEFTGGGMPYTMWTGERGPLGGVMELPEEAKAAGAPPHWVGYVSVEDVDGCIAKAQELGGKVVHPGEDIPNVGRFAVIADPQGAGIAIYKSAVESPPKEGPPQNGEFSWHELATTDYEAAFRFYSELFGWKETKKMDMGNGCIYLMYGQGDVTYGGMFNKPPEMPGPPFWLYYTTVPDVKASAEQVKEAGGKILNGPMQVPGGDWIVQCLDPQGCAFALHSFAPKEG